MARDSSSSSEQLEDEDVSLSDLPHFIEPDQSHSTSTKPDDSGNVIDAEEEFDFGSSMRGSSFLADTKMCAADELFFKGQILPLRLSVSSDNGLTKLNSAQRLSVSGSESMDQHSPCYMSGFKSISDGRSSSCSSIKISPNSSRSNSNSSSSTATTNTSNSSAKPRVVPVRNQFYTHPSPKPQIQVSNGARLENVGSRRSKKSSSIWDFFRLGLVRTPEQDLSKVLRSNSARVNSTRISVSRNSSVNSNNSITLGNNNNTTSKVANGTISDGEKNNVTNTTAALFSEKKSRQNFFSGCKCSFDAVASNAVVPKSHVDKESEAKHEKQADKVAVDLKMKKKKRKKNNGSKQKQLKQDMSHQRTYEWLKGL
uniref:probable membrane-associated kinase regulator 1 n=1 Tax=Fragaria vesca subsp. vesca TaxID=101020 RepID=UPI0005CB2CBE|nr:PREDICTED: probable membrane-associated kinase regulator 1 [Fragaria vesca subsp. vesca]